VLSGDGGEPFGYTGEVNDPQTGLLFLRARYLQAATGRFMSQDRWSGGETQPMSYNGWPGVTEFE
jgi:RHS repeat-associated protein